MFEGKWDVIKKHVSDHRETYIAGGILLALGIVTGYELHRRYGSSTTIVHDDSTALIECDIQTLDGPVLNIYNHRRGRPGKPVLHIESGDIYPSQRSCARSLGTDERTVSRHLNGLQEHANNQHLKTVQIQTPFNKRWKDYDKMLDEAVEEANRTGQLPV